MSVAALEPLKVNIIMVLSHVAPQRLSGTELTLLLGYSKKARTIYRGVLEELNRDGFIILERIGNQYSIGINRAHPLMEQLIELALSFGSKYANSLLDMLEVGRL
jgi:hypothetical protein